VGVFELVNIAEATGRLQRELDDVLALLGGDAAALRARVTQELAARADASTVTLAFVGQYSAGKSTMLAALTGRDDIRIDADIATDVATPYDWQGLVLIDTPGLYTERTDHDETTLTALRQADLLVFCITSNLFDDQVLAHFRHLTYTLGFAPKVFLVVNKMNAEAGDWDARVAAYTRSLDAALAPETLDAYPYAFVDARDYLEGRQFDDPELMDESRFASFVADLHAFATARGVVARYDTPLRISQSAAHDAMELAVRDADGDDAFLLLVGRVSRAVGDTRAALRAAVSDHTLTLSRRIQEIGRDYLEAAAKADDIDLVNQMVEAAVKDAMEATRVQVQEEVQAHAARMQAAIDEELDSALARAFAARVERPDGDFDRFSAQAEEGSQEAWKHLKDMGSNGAKALARAAQGPGAGGGFLAAKEVAGSTLHEGVYAVGKFFGHNFKPWEAVNIAKNLGNVAQAAGMFLAVAGLAYDVYADHHAARREDEQSEARLKVSRSFRTMTSHARGHFQRVLEDQVEPELFGPAEAHLERLRSDRLRVRARDKEVGARLGALDAELRALIGRVHGG
jgi:ethanolamine utilization protein EutP (predicted NTPase)